jgi:hypothetical protein
MRRRGTQKNVTMSLLKRERERDGWIDSQILEFVTEEEIVNCLMNMKKMVARCIIEKLKAIGIDIAL